MYKHARGKVKVEFFIYIHDLIKVYLFFMFFECGPWSVAQLYIQAQLQDNDSHSQMIIKRKNKTDQVISFWLWQGIHCEHIYCRLFTNLFLFCCAKDVFRLKIHKIFHMNEKHIRKCGKQETKNCSQFPDHSELHILR